MPQWATFAGITGVVLVLLLVLSHVTQSSVADTASSRSDSNAPDSDATASSSDDAVPFESTGFESATIEDSRSAVDRQPPVESDDPAADSALENARSAPRETGETARADSHPAGIDPASVSTRMVLANVALSQGLFALVLLGAVLYTGIPISALGVELTWSSLWTGLFVGTVAGLVLYVANEIAAALATRVGFDHDEQLRELLAPDSRRGWVVLLVGVLPIVAVFEELLFRAALIGALSAGFGIDPWLLAVVSSVAFALGHGMQGSVGIVVTGVLGFVLAAVFVLTGSFLVVVVAHYWINALEFVVHEGLELEWATALEQ
ncbi:CPBP family intramembrane metalloprotease [Salinadaptatus halalkaliphilus]|uniref:CPBP family intramembrane metalloprotease n=1 Tax=Salinadaptatus halalkaliphilus TaxID=2419781 RepID=A0A4S3TNZ5_9EURY|nr:CPBP family intramembrane glutamic endopeptidase [Salinadaptatus halalkaliphilus]THE64865.1 CPBP family intramembrane metalloprotease [Salinadaptatus halalkaliphilus]